MSESVRGSYHTIGKHRTFVYLPAYMNGKGNVKQRLLGVEILDHLRLDCRVNSNPVFSLRYVHRQNIIRTKTLSSSLELNQFTVIAILYPVP